MFYHSILYIKIIYYFLPIITINNNNGTSTIAATTASNSNNTGQPPLAQTHIHQRHLKIFKKKKKKKKKNNQRDRHNHKSQTHWHHPKSQIHSSIPKSQITARWWQARSERPGRWDTAVFWPFSSWTSTITMACALWAANSRVVSSHMPLAPPVIMATLLWSLLFEDVECVILFFLCWGRSCESDVRREKKNQLKKWEERESRIKNIILVLACVCTVANCNGTDTNAKICNI